MRGHLLDMVVQHLGDLPARLAANPCTLYDYCPIPPVRYEELDAELWCHNFYLANLCDEVRQGGRGAGGRRAARQAAGRAASTRTRPHAAPPSNAVVVASPRFPSPVFPSSHSSLQARFPDWPIADPVGLLRAVLDAWRSELTKTEEPKGSPDDAYATLGIAVGADEKEIRKAYRKLAIKYVRRRDGARGGLPAAAARPCLHHACHGSPLPPPPPPSRVIIMIIIIMSAAPRQEPRGPRDL